MEIDPAEDGTQQIASVRDYGIEVDFENELEDEEREVRLLHFGTCSHQ